MGEQLLQSPARLAALHRTGLLDNLPAPGLDGLSRLASTVLNVPIVLVSLADAHRQFFKSAVGLPEPWASQREAPLSHFCCRYLVNTGTPLVINDMRVDPRVCDSLVHKFDVIAYAGMPLVTAEGHRLGHFCVIDHRTRLWNEQEQQLLQELTALVMSEIKGCQAIAERQQLATRLRDSEQRYKDFTRAATDWLWETDAEHRYTWFSSNVETATGAPPEWHYGRTRAQIADSDLKTPAWQNHLAQLDAHQPFRDFELCRSGPGGLRWIRANGVPVFDEQGIFQGYRGTGTDITALKQAQAQQAQQRYFQAIEAVGDAIALYDANDCLVICNARYQQLFGSPALQLQPGLSFHQLLQTSLHYGEIEEARGCEAEWLKQRVERFRNPQGSFEQQLADNRWIQLREQRLQTGELLVTGSDITELKRTEQALQQSETQFRSAMEYSAIGMALVAPDGRWLKVNPALCRFFAYSEDELLATDLRAVTHPDDLEIDLHFVQQILCGDIDTYQMEKRYRQKTGQYRWGLLSVSLVRHTGGDPHYFISQIQDIQTRKQTEHALAESEERYRTLYQRTPAMLQSINHEGRFINVSNHWLTMMGYAREDVIGHKVGEFLTKKSMQYAKKQILPEFLRTGYCQDVPYQFLKRNGEIIEVLASAIAERDGKGHIVRSLAVLVDVTERKQLEAELIRLARIDALTGTWNRGYFVTLLNTEIKRARRHRKALSILLCDIDHFKRINDAYGHPAGDSALCHFVAAAQKILCEPNYFGRWGGEEFVVVLPETPLVGAKQAAERLRQHIATLSVVQGKHRFAFTLSIGIGVLSDADTVDTIIARADQALYTAKESGRNRVIAPG
ncbi:MAG: PAS domain S-box protein [Candidatus Competibacteraceae bacterium]|nr:PAS domain S-box protein [Candidatus Competibacteraceae bacterium]